MTDRITCIIVDDEPVAREVMESLLSRIDQVEVIGSCKNAIEAFNIINEQSVDLIFLDINMPEISGLSFARSINSDIKIIFTTAYREYAVEGFDLRAVDYLLKPISFERLFQSINKYIDEARPEKPGSENNPEQGVSDYIFVRSDRKMIKIAFGDILFIESISDYIKIHLISKSVVTRETITSIEAKLPKKDFIRTHRSFIISKTLIDSYTNEFVEIGPRQIPISRSYKDEVLKKLESF
jgi:DNA-binding LytR/AlgR family response regulator